MFNKIKYNYIFVVLVYRNIEVLKDFFVSLDIKDYKVIIVNSYFDDESEKQCATVAQHYNADYIPIPNKGFGYGNNIGAKYAIDHYDYNFLILSNSDIKIENISKLNDYQGQTSIIAPYVHLANGKLQNPNIPFKMDFILPLLYNGYNKPSTLQLNLAHICTRLSREIFHIFNLIYRKKSYKIYSCHGCFIIFTKEAVIQLFPFFDDRMFLYNEELYLAFRAEKLGVNVQYVPGIKIFHMEGASSSSKKEVGREHNKQSFNILWDYIKLK